MAIVIAQIQVQGMARDKVDAERRRDFLPRPIEGNNLPLRNV